MKFNCRIFFLLFAITACQRNTFNENTKLNEKVFIPKGLVLDQKNDKYIEVDSFLIDKYEVSMDEYKNCIQDKKCRDIIPIHPKFPLEKPVNGIYYDDAQKYCKFVGGRLPKYYEWKRSAVGDNRWQYPWGNDYYEGYTNFNHNVYMSNLAENLCSKEQCPKKDISVFGVRNMAGNVGERLEKEGDDYPFMPGGILCDTASCMEVNNKWAFPFTMPIFAVGFRCVYDEPHR